ncbi:ribosome small subunit-dependent GTPase A [Balneolales bacterium ANBcel1]|nr:ribosome small subunit-dependent GTPase A [Balneolales bacterium ANBcel1]
MKGLVVKATGSWYTVRTDYGSFMECRLPGKFRLSGEQVTNPVAVGDKVSITREPEGTGIIEEIEERRNRLIRKATHGKRGIQVIAANVDQVVIVTSFRQPAFKTGFIDRVLVCCEAYEIAPLIVMNKTDLCSTREDSEELEKASGLYQDLGYPMIPISALDTASVQKFLTEHISGKTTVLTGPSGTGKTTLLNVMVPGHDLKTGEVSHASNKGKHTTTFARLIETDDNTSIIDTPGIREFGLVDVEPYEVSLFFPEMKPFREECHFYNCTHKHEPRCAVRAAVDGGMIAESRYKSYLNILESI